MQATQPTTDYFRFCPGEEKIRISNAICRGRRRSHYPACHGCRFNDDEVAASNAVGAPDRPDPGTLIEAVFQAYDVCATVPTPLSQDIAWRIGHATAQYLRAKLRGYDRADPETRSLIVGRDMRTHSIILQQALIQGIRAAGLDVIDVGAVDTPQLYFAVHHSRACGGIQTTAGHRSAEYNGFVFCGAKAVPLTPETGLASIRDLAIRVPKHNTGTLSRLIQRDFSKPYIDFLRALIPGDGALPRRLKVVIDAGNGMAGKLLPDLFDGVRKLTVIPMNTERRGRFQHDPDPTELQNTRSMRALVKQRKADFGICFSSDAAQCSFADHRGNAVPADMISVLFAKMFLEREPGATILLDLRSSQAATEEIERAGGLPILGRVSPIFIKKAMSERKAVFGADLSGRFYFRELFHCESGPIALVHMMNILATAGRPLSDLVRPIQRYRSSGECHYRCPDPDRALNDLAEAHADAQIDHLDGLTIRYPDWWCNVRPSRADSLLHVTLEAKTRKIVDARLSDLAPHLGQSA